MVDAMVNLMTGGFERDVADSNTMLGQTVAQHGIERVVGEQLYLSQCQALFGEVFHLGMKTLWVKVLHTTVVIYSTPFIAVKIGER